MDTVGCGTRAVSGRKNQPWNKLAKRRECRERAITRDTELELEKLQFMINEVPEIAYAVMNLSRQLAQPSELDMQDLKQCVRYTLRHSDEWVFLTVQDKSRKTEEVTTIEVHADAVWARDAKSMKSTSSVFTKIDGFTIGLNAQLQDTHAQSSGESEFYALGAGCADAL